MRGICMYVYIYIHTYIHTYTHAHTHTHIYQSYIHGFSKDARGLSSRRLDRGRFKCSVNGFHKVVRAVSGFTGFLYQDLLVSRFHQGLYIIWHIHECFQGNWSVAVRCGFCNSDAAADDGDDYD